MLVACALVAAGFALNAPWARNAVMSVVAPVSRAGVVFSEKTLALAPSFFYFREQSAMVEKLNDENAFLRARAVNAAALERENELLRKQLGVGKPDQREFAMADIVSYDPYHFAQYALIDKGSGDGIAEGMPVIMPGDIVVGKIYKTYPRYSHVMLITDKNNKVSVTSQNTNVSGVLDGAIGNTVLMDLLEKSASLETGDSIITSGLDGIYPKNLIVGAVNQVVSEAGDIFKQAYIKPAYASFARTQVFVITNYLR